MTTGRINQVRTIGGAGTRRAPPARVRAGGGAPTRARPHAGPPRASSAGKPPQPGLGGFGRPGASPHASEECASGRAGGRVAHAGWPPRALVRQPPACAAVSLGPLQAASDALAHLPAPRRSAPRAGLGAELPMRGGPLGRSLASPRPAPSSPGQTASPPPSGSHVRSASASMRQAVATASALPLGRPPLQKDTSRLSGCHRLPQAPGPSRCDGAPAHRRTGARIRTPHGRPPARFPATVRFAC